MLRKVVYQEDKGLWFLSEIDDTAGETKFNGLIIKSWYDET